MAACVVSVPCDPHSFTVVVCPGRIFPEKERRKLLFAFYFSEPIVFLSLFDPSSLLSDLSFPFPSTSPSVCSDPVSISVTSGLLCSLSMSLSGFLACD